MKLLNRDAKYWNAIFNPLSEVSMTPEIRAQIDQLRARIAASDPTLTLEDMAIAVSMYREARGAVSSNIEKKKAAAEKKEKAPKAGPKSADELLDGFLGAGDAPANNL